MSDKYTLVRHSHAGDKFEILVDPDKGLSYKRGERNDINGVLMIETIFTDSNKGEKASLAKLEEVFGTSDPIKVAEIMFEKGTFLLTANQRREMTEKKLRQIISIISRTYVDPSTKLPHPSIRVENAINETRVSIDPFKDAEEQVKKVVDFMRQVNRILDVVDFETFCLASFNV